MWYNYRRQKNRKCFENIKIKIRQVQGHLAGKLVSKGGVSMINKIKKISFTLALLALIMPVVALADVDPGGFDAGLNETASGNASNAGLTVNRSFGEIIGSAISWLMGILATLSVLMFVVAGIMYVTAGGDEETIGKAKKFITYAITGIVIALVGFLIVQVIGNIAGNNPTK